MRVHVAKNLGMCLALQGLVCYLAAHNAQQMTPKHHAMSIHRLPAQMFLVNLSRRDA
jgi:hypothetical protein